MPDNQRGFRELPVDAALNLPGLWVSAGFGDAPTEPPTPLGWNLVVDDAELLGRALSERGASLPRLSRRLVRVGGYGYQPLTPLSRAASALAPLDASALALAVAGEARSGMRRLIPDRAHLSTIGRGRLLVRVRRGIGKLERGVLRHERDAAQHYRWLVEMDLGILPDDALGTTLEECAAIQRATRGLEIEASLDLLTTYSALVSYGVEQRGIPVEALALAALVPDALELPSATPALALSCVAQLEVRGRALGDKKRFSAALSGFLEGFGERGPSEYEPFMPRWREQPARVARLAQLLARADLGQFELRIVRARNAREALLKRVLESLGPLEAALFRSLVVNVRKLVVLRSRLNLVRARTLAMLRTTVLDVDRRLARLIGTDPNSAFFLSLAELLSSTVRPKPELGQLSRERRAAWTSALASPAPPAVLGRAARSESETLLTGVGVGGSRLEGVALVTSNFDRALELPARGVLVTRSLHVGWAPLLLGAAAVVTDAGGLTDEGTLVASALGVPLVLGTMDATRRIANGAKLRVDAGAGTVTIG